MTWSTNPRDSQRGSAMLVTLILISALLAGIAVLVSLQLASSRSTELTRSGMTALYCAEAGLAVARPLVAQNRATVNAHLTANGATRVQPTFLTTAFAAASPDLSDIDGDGEFPDFEIYVIDNDDEPGANDYAVDVDARVFIISRCTKYPDTPKQITELVEYTAQPTMYDWQDGRGFGNNNANPYQ